MPAYLNVLARVTRGGLALLLIAFVSLCSSSCVGLLDLNEFESAPTALCDFLRQCYSAQFFGQCEGHVSPRLTGADAAMKQSWLADFSDDRCLENCTNARLCLDNEPVCVDVGGSCPQREACCGFLTGKSDCGTAGACCRPDGNACTSNDDCCTQRCLGEEGSTFCGGFECIDAGEACTEDFECCTKNCVRDEQGEGVCADQICQEEGGPCEANADCCDGFCDLEDRRCRAPLCDVIGEPCTEDAQCCSQLCFRGDPNDPNGFCSTGQCLPEGTPCDPIAVDQPECCDGFCDPQFLFCRAPCGGVGEPCGGDEDCCNSTCSADGTCGCVDDGDICFEQSDCCSGTCSPTQVCGACNAPACSHDVCTIGGPLQPDCLCQTCEGNANLPMAVTACVPTICSQFPDCCCVEWSAQCVAAVGSICGAYCPPT